jgi:hypothetical protein
MRPRPFLLIDAPLISRASLPPIILLFSLFAGAQVTTSGTLHIAPSDPERYPALFYPEEKQPPVVEGPVLGAPFEARLTIAVRLKGADGSDQTEAEATNRSRDSAGRVRDQSAEIEQRLLGGTGKAYKVNVRDPVSHCDISWEEPRPTNGRAIAMFLCLPKVVAYAAPSGPLWDPSKVPEDSGSAGQEEHVRALPDQMIEGVKTIGIRSETQIQAHGQQHAGHSVIEMRYSPELSEMMLTQEDSFDAADQSMHTQTALTNLRRAEPDASLFYPPVGYERVDGRSKSSH